MDNGPGLKMHFLFEMGIFQPAMWKVHRLRTGDGKPKPLVGTGPKDLGTQNKFRCFKQNTNKPGGIRKNRGKTYFATEESWMFLLQFLLKITSFEDSVVNLDLLVILISASDRSMHQGNMELAYSSTLSFFQVSGAAQIPCHNPTKRRTQLRRWPDLIDIIHLHRMFPAQQVVTGCWSNFLIHSVFTMVPHSLLSKPWE